MTKTEIALSAIRGMRPSRTAHLDINSVMRTLALTTDEAVELRVMVRREWLASDHGTDLAEVLNLAKSVTNQYARDYSVR